MCDWTCAHTLASLRACDLKVRVLGTACKSSMEKYKSDRHSPPDSSMNSRIQPSRPVRPGPQMAPQPLLITPHTLERHSAPAHPGAAASEGAPRATRGECPHCQDLAGAAAAGRQGRGHADTPAASVGRKTCRGRRSEGTGGGTLIAPP